MSLCVDVEIIVDGIITTTAVAEDAADGITTIIVAAIIGIATTTVNLIITIITAVATIITTTIIVTAIENVVDVTGTTTVDVAEKDASGMTTVDVVEKDASGMTTVDVVEKDASGMTTVIGTEITKIEIMHMMSGTENVKNINDHIDAVAFATNIQSYLQWKRTCPLVASPFSIIRITYFDFVIHNIYTL